MTDRRTAHGALIPQNENKLGRPPRGMHLDDPRAVAYLTDPGLMTRLRDLAQTDPALYNELCVDLNQHYRAMNAERSLPGEYNGDDLPHQPLPFSPRETFRPDREPHTEAGRIVRKAVENIEAGLMTEALQERMGTDHRAAEPSTWERTAYGVTTPVDSYRPQSRDDAPPSLREQITAAASLDYPKE